MVKVLVIQCKEELQCTMGTLRNMPSFSFLHFFRIASYTDRISARFMIIHSIEIINIVQKDKSLSCTFPTLLDASILWSTANSILFIYFKTADHASTLAIFTNHLLHDNTSSYLQNKIICKRKFPYETRPITLIMYMNKVNTLPIPFFYCIQNLRACLGTQILPTPLSLSGSPIGASSNCPQHLRNICHSLFKERPH